MSRSRAMILCLGQATRMRPLSLGMPKSLLPFCNRSLLDYTLERLLSCGIRDIFLVVGLGVEAFDDYPAWGQDRGANITVVPRRAFGSAAAVRDAASQVVAEPDR